MSNTKYSNVPGLHWRLFLDYADITFYLTKAKLFALEQLTVKTFFQQWNVKLLLIDNHNQFKLKYRCRSRLIWCKISITLFQKILLTYWLQSNWRNSSIVTWKDLLWNFWFRWNLLIKSNRVEQYFKFMFTKINRGSYK